MYAKVRTPEKNTYMDDVCDSQPSVEAAKELILDVDEVLDAGGFGIKEWISNVALTDQKISNEVVLGKPKENDVQKVLGTVWHPKDDQFWFAVKSVPSNEETCTSTKMTKRIILGKLSGIFDPVGAGVATLVKAKIGMQELWQRGLSWDEEIPPDLKKKWTMLFKEMAALEKVRFRWKQIVRITTYVQRFCRALQVKHDHDDKNMQRELEHLTTEELQAAEEYWIKHAQSSLVRRLKEGEFKMLSPFVDDRKIIRVGSRVDPSLVLYENERPVLLPYDHYLSKIIVRDAHEVGHNGVAATVAKTRKKYWIINPPPGLQRSSRVVVQFAEKLKQKWRPN